MDKRFLSTLNEIPGYEIVETMGVIIEPMGLKGCDGLLKKLMRKAEDEGCNAIIHFRMVTGEYGSYAYCEGVVVRPKAKPAPDLPEVPDYTNTDNNLF
jgi:uncharacterized protein YbjQ (UPF0145 family)